MPRLFEDSRDRIAMQSIGILVSTRVDLIDQDRGDQWDSQKVASEDSNGNDPGRHAHRCEYPSLHLNESTTTTEQSRKSQDLSNR